MSEPGVGRKTVTTAGTPERIVASKNTYKVAAIIITALATNTGTVVIGDSTVIAAEGTRKGSPLEAGQSVAINASEIDLYDIYIDATVSADGISWMTVGR
jgi:hypothetical protein